MTRPDVSQHVMCLSEVTVRFGNTRALDSLSIEVPRGVVFGLVGANGSGKTTLMRLACGLIKPASGKGQCLAESLFAKYPSRRRHIGYMAQSTTLYDELTVRENLEFRAALIGDKTARSHGERHALTHVMDTRVRALSGGWRQRAAFACATLGSPQLIILDEPTSGLDLVARDAMWHATRELTSAGTTVLVSTHDPAEAAQCDAIAILSQGTAAFVGTVRDIANGLHGIESLIRASIRRSSTPPATP